MATVAPDASPEWFSLLHICTSAFWKRKTHTQKCQKRVSHVEQWLTLRLFCTQQSRPDSLHQKEASVLLQGSEPRHSFLPQLPWFDFKPDRQHSLKGVMCIKTIKQVVKEAKLTKTYAQRCYFLDPSFTKTAVCAQSHHSLLAGLWAPTRHRNKTLSLDF